MSVDRRLDTATLFAALLLYGALASLVGCASFARIGRQTAGESCIPRFPFQEDWWGADAAYSIPLPDGRSVWIFGDTLYGDSRALEGGVLRIVRNSVGVSTCAGGKWAIDYVLRRTPSGNAMDFFPSPDSGHWYWALDGFVNGGALYVTLLCIRDQLPYGFATCGSDLARVSDLNRNPQDWTVEYFRLVPRGIGAYPSASAVVYGENAYIFALDEKASTRPVVLTRIPLARLDSPGDSIEYYARDGSWKRGFVPSDAAEVMKFGTPELSVRYHPELNEWIAVMVDPNVQDAIVMRTAHEIVGPWTEGEILYRVPELAEDSREKHPNWFCYAGKEHPEFGTPDTLLITYVCNSWVPKELLEDLNLYVPKVVKLPIPPNP